MFDFRNAAGAQRAAIATIDGPVLITGGPGTGKTWVLAHRAAYMVLERGIQPQNILFLSRSPQNVQKIRSQVEQVFDSRGISWASPRLSIETFASYSGQILSTSPVANNIATGSRVLDPVSQQFLIYLSYPFLRRAVTGMGRIEDEVADWQLEGREERWVYAGVVRDYVNRLTEALVDPEELLRAEDTGPRVAGLLMTEYRKLLKRDYLNDQSLVQAEALSLLRDQPQVLARARALTQYILIDDYQDTTCVGGQIAALVAGPSGNLCAAGDEDQALMRKNGGRADNIFGFATLVPEKPCQTIVLNVNFRSNDDIIRFDDAWMSSVNPAESGFSWGRFRKPRVSVGTGRSLRSPAVVRMQAADQAAWQKEIARFARSFTAGGKDRDLRQIAVLTADIRTKSMLELAEYLQKNGVPVFAPDTNMFFHRPEVQTAVGTLWIASGLDAAELSLRDDIASYYISASEKARSAADGQLAAWAAENVDRTLPSILAGMLIQPPFDGWMTSVAGTMSAETCALTLLADALERCMRIPSLAGHTDKRALFFGEYLPVLLRNGLQESSAPFPEGHIMVRTIASARGKGFPCVLAVLPDRSEVDHSGDLADQVERRFSPDPPKEPQEYIDRFDAWRRYYTAFSRAEDLLILTSCGQQHKDAPMTSCVVQALPPADVQQFNLAEFTFHPAKGELSAIVPPKVPVSAPPRPASSVGETTAPLPASHPAAPLAQPELSRDDKKSASPAGETRRFMRSVFVSAAGKNHVGNDAGNNEETDHQSDD